MDRNFRNPFVTTWTLGVEHTFTADLSLNVAYVGNHGARMPGITDAESASSGSRQRQRSPRSLRRTIPYLDNINWLSNLYTSNYNGLQATLTQRAAAWIIFCRLRMPHLLSFAGRLLFQYQYTFAAGQPISTDETTTVAFST